MTPYFNQNCEIAHNIRKMEKVFGRKSSHPWKFKLYDPHPRKTFLSTYGSSTHMNTRTNGACNSWAWAFFSIDPDWPLCVAISAQVHRPAFLQVFVQVPILHYSRFEVFLSKIGMHVKIVQIEFFVIESLIRIHVSSLKKVLPKSENWQKKFLILLTESQFSWTFFALY